MHIAVAMKARGMTLIRICLPIVIAVMSIAHASGQDYRLGLGLRLGTDAGLTAKYFLQKTLAAEALVSTRWSGFLLTGLLESHHRPFSNPEFKLYFGGGVHFATWNGNHIHPWFPTDGVVRSIFGFDGIIGLEYTFRKIPLNLGVDWKPAINLSDYKWVWLDNGGLSVRYTFK